MARGRKTQSLVGLDTTFYRELFRFYRENKGLIRGHYHVLTRSLLDYNDPDKATECEGSHSLPESVASCKFLPYCEYPERVQIKFKNGKRIEYKKVSGVL